MWGALQYTAILAIMLFRIHAHVCMQQWPWCLGLIKLAGTLAVCSKKMRSSNSPAIRFLSILPLFIQFVCCDHSYSSAVSKSHRWALAIPGWGNAIIWPHVCMQLHICIHQDRCTCIQSKTGEYLWTLPWQHTLLWLRLPLFVRLLWFFFVSKLPT